MKIKEQTLPIGYKPENYKFLLINMNITLAVQNFLFCLLSRDFEDKRRSLADIVSFLTS